MPTPEPGRLHSNLIAAGRARRMPWEKIAAASGLGLRGLDRVMQGKERISSADLDRIARALQVDPLWLLTGTGPVPVPGERHGMQMTACAQRPIARTNPPAHVRAILGRRNPRMVEITAEVPAGLEDSVTDALLGALDEYGIGGMGVSVPAGEYEANLAELGRLREFADWLLAMDLPSNPDRRGATLNQIIRRARQARGQERHADHR